MDRSAPSAAVWRIARVLNAIYGPDGHDRTVTAAVPQEPRTPVSKLRAGIVQKAFDRIG